jgi:hypothetical protein
MNDSFPLPRPIKWFVAALPPLALWALYSPHLGMPLLLVSQAIFLVLSA